MKSNLYRLPIIGYPSYDDSSIEMAFVVPVFKTATRQYPEMVMIDEYVKSAISVGRSLFVNTNVVEHRIPIYYLLEDAVFDTWKFHFTNANIRPDRLLVFTATDSPVKTNRVSKKLYALTDSVLKGYNCYQIIDADLFACCNPLINQKIDVTLLIGDTIGTLWFDANWKNVESLYEVGNWFNKWGIPRDKAFLKKNRDITEQHLRSVFPSLSVKTGSVYVNRVGGGIIRFANPLPNGFEEFCMSLEPLLGDDELVLALYSTYHNHCYESFADRVDIVFKPDELLSVRESKPYWAHISNASYYADKWELVFQRDIGVNDRHHLERTLRRNESPNFNNI